MLFERGTLVGAGVFLKMEMGGNGGGLEKGERVDLMGGEGRHGLPSMLRANTLSGAADKGPTKTQRAWF